MEALQPCHAEECRDAGITHRVLPGTSLKLSHWVKEISNHSQTHTCDPSTPEAEAGRPGWSSRLAWPEYLKNTKGCWLPAAHSEMASSSLVAVACPQVSLQMLFSPAEVPSRHQLASITQWRRRLYWLLVLFVSEISTWGFSCRYFH